MFEMKKAPIKKAASAFDIGNVTDKYGSARSYPREIRNALANSVPITPQMKETLEWIGISLSGYDSRMKLVGSTSSLVFQLDVIDRYMVGDLLGIGSYGIVKTVIDSVSLRRCAVKIFIAKRLRRIPNGLENVEKELKLMRRLKHENIVKVYDIARRGEDSFMVMELCKCNVEEMMEITPNKRLPMTICHHFFKQLIGGLEYLQSKGIVHMDIKPDNLLVSYDNNLRISDFGVALLLDEFSKSDKCTRYWGCPIIQPPEVARGDDSFSGFKLDVWCCGVTLFKIITGEYPYNAYNEFLLIKAILEKDFVIPIWLDKIVANLITDLLEFNADKRPTVEQIKSHRWLTNIYSEKQFSKDFGICSLLKEKSVLTDILFHFHHEENNSYQEKEVVQNVFWSRSQGYV